MKALTLKYGVCLIQCPPGTEKTEMLAALLEQALWRKHRSMVCTPTNIALKESCLRLLQRRTRVAKQAKEFTAPVNMISSQAGAFAGEAFSNPSSGSSSKAPDEVRSWKFADVALVASQERAEVLWGELRSAVFLDHRKKRIKRVHVGTWVKALAQDLSHFLSSRPGRRLARDHS